MIAVLFEVEPRAGRRELYLRAAAELRPHLDAMPGFVSVERFQSLASPERLLSLSYWRDEEAVRGWRLCEPHRRTQCMGREHAFADYRLRVAEVVRDYGMHDRAQAPTDARLLHG